MLDKPELYIGLMSGTSADAIDAVVVSINNQSISIINNHSLSYPNAIRHEILALSTPGENEIVRMGILDQKLGDLFAQTTIELLEKSNIDADKIHAIGSHGQTIRHYPPSVSQHPFSLQIGDANIIAQQTGITTVTDFRRKDIAAGGEGAPLVPAFHNAVFSDKTKQRVILNIGGMANISILNFDNECTGFDTGPGNALMDAWIYQHKQQAYDDKGSWSKTGTSNTELLGILLGNPYFQSTPPKSTGRETFNSDWLKNCLSQTTVSIKPEDIQATLLELTAISISNSIKNYAKECSEVYVCGGGAFNQALIQSLHNKLTPIMVTTTESLGIPPQWVEAAAFGWLAHQTMHNKPANCPKVTGAKHSAILGGIYPA